MFNNKKVHFIGIGGISMSGIAEIVKSLGGIVSGSDIQESQITEKLIQDGMNIKIGHHPEMIKDADIIIYTAAIHEDDPERIEVKKLHKENYERAEFLGIISKQYENSLCISGTHRSLTLVAFANMDSALLQ